MSCTTTSTPVSSVTFTFTAWPLPPDIPPGTAGVPARPLPPPPPLLPSMAAARGD